MSNVFEGTPQRHARGSYSKLICLNCRARKIKCNLPENVQIEPSQSPQPPERACQRCLQQGLDCVVDKTILGRPTPKRQRPDQPKTETERCDDDVAGEESEHVPEVQDFVLSDLRDEVDNIDSVLASSAKAKPSKHEVFESLMDSTHLLSALMARDAKFGRLFFVGNGHGSSDPTVLINESIARVMDEHLVWHRLHCPYLPTMTSLRTQLLVHTNSQSMSSSQALFALLGLIALDVPSKSLRFPEKQSQQLQGVVNSFCQSVLFDLPVHRHALFVFDLIDTYKPLALAGGQSVAAASIKGNLSTTLAKRTAQKLSFDTATDRLDVLLQRNVEIDKATVEALVLEALQWGRWLLLESILDGYVMKSVPEQRGPLPKVRKLLSVVRRAVDAVSMPPAIILMYHHMGSANIEMQAAVAGKQNWLDLAAMGKLIESYGQKCEAHVEYLTHLLEHCDRTNEDRVDEEIVAVKRLRSMDLNASQVRIAGLCMFYGLMSGLRPRDNTQKARDVTPDEAMQVSSEIISNLKTKHDTLSDPTSVASFIAKNGDPRFARQEQILRDFIDTADKLHLCAVPYVAPSIPMVSILLFTCREIVENNATRLKGWGGMHPNVDVHILLLQDTAKRLENMDSAGGGPNAIGKGSMYAAGAKLVKSLCSIVAAWRREIAEQEVRNEAAKAAMSNELDGVEAFLSGDLFDDWKEWPQTEDLDLAGLLEDGMEWVDWAQFTTPLDDSSIVWSFPST